MEYKTIAGPVGLTAEGREDYDEAVKKYAAIIDHNAVGGWELAWIQQIPVTKLKPNISGIISLAVLGAIIGAGIAMASSSGRYGPEAGEIIGGIIVGGGICAGIGAAVCKNKIIEFFNMLVFAKKK